MSSVFSGIALIVVVMASGFAFVDVAPVHPGSGCVHVSDEQRLATGDNEPSQERDQADKPDGVGKKAGREQQCTADQQHHSFQYLGRRHTSLAESLAETLVRSQTLHAQQHYSNNRRQHDQAYRGHHSDKSSQLYQQVNLDDWHD